ncbi:unnamed protein product [Cercopithifilaria johnstoni]|uniref:Uncharacterized protein n=1 Tax=Cercopithifilaria johnstoni TaxID=2874296 RepID=A0A8J2MIN0_9BILA|nr:unnamed protein product [Cercopithifilaria johnstoni]
MIGDGKLCTDYFMNHMMTNGKEFNQGRINLTDQRVNEQYVRPENGYKRHSANKSARKGCRETITAYQNSNNFQRPFVMKRSHSMTDLTNEYRKIGQARIDQSNEYINNGFTNSIRTSNRSQITVGKMPCSRYVHRSGSLKNFKMPTTEGVRRILSREEINLTNSLRTNNAHITSPNNNLKSLVSFDPKSKILLRIHNHIDDDADVGDSCDREDSNTYHQRQQQQRQKQQKQQQQRISGKTSSTRAAEHMQHQNSKYSSMNNLVTICQPNDLNFGFIAADNNGYYNLNSFDQNCNQRSSNSLRPRSICYSKYGDDILYNGRKECNYEKSSAIDHPKSSIISGVSTFNSNDFLV